ncbi:MAG: tRNA (adenosine(37)-N6)-threonylcarbamoyltransferase complex ATPase subunit type 1 TsaE [Bacteroidia bacterium]|nr:tRNA (adenosine(37)-N6)-threonylcarbamoyltransferase complex ATPase subunit type 1 TsaE [Bacteroidia bacterium]
MNYSVHFDLEEIDAVAKKVLDTADSKVILFYGEMGVGKTTLIKALVKALGGTVEATSPTFSLINEYEVENDLVYHLDLYRLEDAYEALDIGIEDYLYSGRWVFVEWPAKIDVLLPKEAVKLHLNLDKSGSRALDLEFVSENFKKS